MHKLGVIKKKKSHRLQLKIMCYNKKSEGLL